MNGSIPGLERITWTVLLNHSSDSHLNQSPNFKRFRGPQFVYTLFLLSLLSLILHLEQTYLINESTSFHGSLQYMYWLHVYSSFSPSIWKLILYSNRTCAAQSTPILSASLEQDYTAPYSSIKTIFYSSKHTVYLFTLILPFSDEGPLLMLLSKEGVKLPKTRPDFTKSVNMSI